MFMPSFSGHLSPYWNPHSSGSIVGLSYNSSPVDIYRACLEGIAFSVQDCVTALEKSVKLNTITADGGVSTAKYCMQFQSDIMNKKIRVSDYPDCTPLGVALGAAWGAGYFKSIDDLKQFNPSYSEVEPQEDKTHLYKKWKLTNENNIRLCEQLKQL